MSQKPASPSPQAFTTLVSLDPALNPFVNAWTAFSVFDPGRAVDSIDGLNALNPMNVATWMPAMTSYWTGCFTVWQQSMNLWQSLMPGMALGQLWMEPGGQSPLTVMAEVIVPGIVMPAADFAAHAVMDTAGAALEPFVQDDEVISAEPVRKRA